MLTIPRIKRFIKAIEMDDDSILGDSKETVINTLLIIGRKYAAYKRLCSNDALVRHLKSMFKSGLPNELYDEAIDIIAEAIDQDSKENDLPVALYRTQSRSFIQEVVREHEQDAHNLLVVDYAFGEKRYIPPENQPKTARKPSALLNEDWAKDGLSEEESLDEIDPI